MNALPPSRIGLIHATALAMDPIEAAFARLWPAAVRTNLLDDSLSLDRAAAAELQPSMFERFRTLARYAVGCGCDGLLFTCSAFGPAIEAAAAEVDVPVLKPNEAMFEQALAIAVRDRTPVALVATFAPSLPTMAAEFHAMASDRGAVVELRTLHVPDAMDDLARGDAERHHRRIADAAAGLHDCPTVMLAQFSMAAAQPAAAAALPWAAILSSPDCAVTALRERILRV